jgi:methylated-DNA-[protein]-cysteine S-methyltransferase
MSKSQSRVRIRKEAARDLLSRRDLQAYREWATDDKQVLRTLASLLFETDDRLRWRAIEAIGIAAGVVRQRDQESVRHLVRRLFWLMNDESGGICWCAPEAIAEIIVNCPELISEYGKMLATFLIEEPFEAGTRWAISRIGHLKPETFAKKHQLLLDSLESDIPEWRAYSLLALQALKVNIPAGQLDTLRQDGTTVPFYDFTTGELQQFAISDLIP